MIDYEVNINISIYLMSKFYRYLINISMKIKIKLFHISKMEQIMGYLIKKEIVKKIGKIMMKM